MRRAIRDIDRGPRTIDGIDLHLTELVWDDGRRSFEVRRTDTDADLTEDGCLDTWPTDQQLANLLRDHAGTWLCPGCGATSTAARATASPTTSATAPQPDRSSGGPRDR